MARTADSLEKLERRLEIIEAITKDNIKEICEEYGIKENTAEKIYFLSKNEKKVTELKWRIESLKDKLQPKFTQEDVDKAVIDMILKFEAEGRNYKDICLFLKRDLSEIEKLIGRKYKNFFGGNKSTRELL